MQLDTIFLFLAWKFKIYFLTTQCPASLQNVAKVFAFIYLHCVKQGLIRKAELMKAFVNFAKFIMKMTLKQGMES